MKNSASSTRNLSRLSRWALAVCIGTACCSNGCAVWKKPAFPKIAKTGKDAKCPEPELPTNLVALWSDSVYYQPGGAPTRGLGGRVYFYDKSDDTIAVNGELIVYAFEDDGANGGPQKEPVKKYIFKQEDLAAHFSPSEFGPSYSFWLPWDSDLGQGKAVSVVPVFKDASGQIVMGQHARHRLPGATDADRAVQEAETLPPPLARYDAPTTPQVGMNVTSIPLPERTAALLANSGNYDSPTTPASSASSLGSLGGTGSVQPTAYQGHAAAMQVVSPTSHGVPSTAASALAVRPGTPNSATPAGPTNSFAGVPAAQPTPKVARSNFGFQPRSWQDWQEQAKQSQASVVQLPIQAAWTPAPTLPTPAATPGAPGIGVPGNGGAPGMVGESAAVGTNFSPGTADGLRPTTVTMGPVPSGPAGAQGGSRNLPALMPVQTGPVPVGSAQAGVPPSGVSSASEQVIRLPQQ